MEQKTNRMYDKFSQSRRENAPIRGVDAIKVSILDTRKAYPERTDEEHARWYSSKYGAGYNAVLKVLKEAAKKIDCDGYVLKVNEKYFGYDNHPQYPEAEFEDLQKAYVFKNQESIESLLGWYKKGKVGAKFKIIPVKRKLVEVE